MVEAVGRGVRGLKSGDEVYSRPDITRDGAYAEYITIDESLVALKPVIDRPRPCRGDSAGGDDSVAGSLRCGRALAPGRESSSTLLPAASARFAVQLAKWKGAYVIGTASTRNQDFLRDLGADGTIDYQYVAFETVVRDVDMVLDTIGGDTQERSWTVLKKGGILVSIVSPPSPEKAAAHGVRQAYVFLEPKLPQLQADHDAGRFGEAPVPIVDTVAAASRESSQPVAPAAIRKS